ncbi:MAG: Transcriptional regulatory protein NatR [Peptostreptococcus russellii]
MKVLVCDDTKEDLKKIKDILSSIDFIDDIITSSNGKDAIKIAKNNYLDLIITDIDMPSTNGMDAVSEIKNKYLPKVKVVFMTAYPEYALKSYESRPIDFLVKPVDKNRLVDSVSIAHDMILSDKLSSTPEVSDSIFVYKFRKNINMLNFDNILFFEKNGRSINILLDSDEKITFYEDFNELNSRLPKIFFKSSPKYIVNLQKIYRLLPSGKNKYEINFLASNLTAVLNKELESDFLFKYHRSKF